MPAPTNEDFATVEWEPLLARASRRIYHEYMIVLGESAEAAKSSGDPVRATVLGLLARAAAPALRADDDEHPLAVRLYFDDGSRTTDIGDFKEDELRTLREVAPTVADPEMRARLADIAWLTAKDHKLGRMAVEAYLASAKALEGDGSWIDCLSRLQRAVSIGASLGGDALAQPLAHLDRLLADSEKVAEPSFFPGRLLSIRWKLRQGDALRDARLAEVHAQRAEAARLWDMACQYWRHAGAFYERAKDAAASRAARKRAAECLVSEAEDGAKRGAAVAAHFLERAIQTYRRIGGEKTKVDELHRRMLVFQKKAAAEMKLIDGGKIDLSEEARRAEAAVRGKTFIEALVTLCRFSPPPPVEDLRKSVTERAQQFVHTRLFGTSLVTRDGKVIDRRGPVPGQAKEDDDATNSEMYSLANWHRELNAHGLIEPARREIWHSHPCTMDEFMAIVVDNPFVPRGREHLFAKGLHAGIAGDFGVALHVLMPQVENSIRYVLEQRGAITSTLDEDGIQNERDLNAILYESEAKELFGENLLFEARGLLIKRFGANLRNRMAHGLLHAGDCYGPQSLYFWWWTLRLVCAPHTARIEVFSSAKTPADEESPASPTEIEE